MTRHLKRKKDPSCQSFLTSYQHKRRFARTVSYTHLDAHCAVIAAKRLQGCFLHLGTDGKSCAGRALGLSLIHILPVPKISRRMMIHHQLLPKAQNPD